MNGSIILLYYIVNVPNIHKNIVSVLVLDKKSYTIVFKSDIIIISMDNVSAKGIWNHDLYILNIINNKVSVTNYVNAPNDFIYL